jgi:hypothetical protein
MYEIVDRLCGLVVRVPGYRTRGLGSIPGATRISEKLEFFFLPTVSRPVSLGIGPPFGTLDQILVEVVVGLEQGPLSLVSTTEELLERKSSGSGLESREYGWRDQSR